MGADCKNMQRVILNRFCAQNIRDTSIKLWYEPDLRWRLKSGVCELHSCFDEPLWLSTTVLTENLQVCTHRDQPEAWLIILFWILAPIHVPAIEVSGDPNMRTIQFHQSIRPL
jgi:hypothetical protein